MQTQAPESKLPARTNAQRQLAWRRRQAAKRALRRATQIRLAARAVEERIANRRALGLPMEKEEILQRKASGEDFESILQDMQARLPAEIDETAKEVSFETLMSMSRGMYLVEAPAGCGKLVTGGYDSKKIEQIVTPTHHYTKTDGIRLEHRDDIRRVQPRGHGPDEDE